MTTMHFARTGHAVFFGVMALLLCPNATTIAADATWSIDQHRRETRADGRPLVQTSQAAKEEQEQRVRETLGRLERERLAQEERRNAEREQVEKRARDAKENAERERNEHERKRTFERAEQQRRIEQYKEQIRSSPSSRD
jgi:preprotein translocase subunit SecF